MVLIWGNMHTVRTVIVKDNNPRVLKCLKTLLYIHNSKCNSGHRVGSDIRGRFFVNNNKYFNEYISRYGVVAVD